MFPLVSLVCGVEFCFKHELFKPYVDGVLSVIFSVILPAGGIPVSSYYVKGVVFCFGDDVMCDVVV